MDELKNSKIMIVDDDDFHREMMIDVLENAGCEVISAENGEVAISLLGEFSPDAIVTDIEMPVMDGISLIKKVKSLHPAMKILMVSGNLNREYQEIAGSFDVEILQKPVPAKILLENINDLISS